MERFHSKYEVHPVTGCWVWQASKIGGGYGKFKCKKLTKSRYAHRVSYIMHKGEIPEGQVVMHTCDNPSCVNPDHLSLGTQKDNMLDASRKGRLKRRSISPRQVREARWMYSTTDMSYKSVAEMYGVSAQTVHNWLNQADRRYQCLGC